MQVRRVRRDNCDDLKIEMCTGKNMGAGNAIFLKLTCRAAIGGLFTLDLRRILTRCQFVGANLRRAHIEGREGHQENRDEFHPMGHDYRQGN